MTCEVCYPKRVFVIQHDQARLKLQVTVEQTSGYLHRVSRCSASEAYVQLNSNLILQMMISGDACDASQLVNGRMNSAEPKHVSKLS
jgi:hypothetical protein